MKRRLLLISLLLGQSVAIADTSFELESSSGDTFTINHHIANQDELFIWFTHQDHHSKGYENVVSGLQQLGKDTWQIDLLDAYFLEANSDNVRNLPSESISIPLKHALTKPYKRITLVATGHLAGTVLRGLHQWQALDRPDQNARRRVSGSILFFPDLVAYTPAAGESPTYQNIIKSTNYPTFLFQPGHGKSLSHLPSVLKQLNTQSETTFAWIQGDLMDWYFLYTEDDELPTPAVIQEIESLPQRLIIAADFLSQQQSPKKPLPLKTPHQQKSSIRGLKEWSPSLVAPSLSLRNLIGKEQSLDTWEGKVILLNFWASWCAPCVEEIPSMNELRRKFEGRDFEIVSVNFRESESDIKKFTNKIPIDFPILLDKTGETSTRWKVPAYPSSFILDNKSNIRYSINAGIDWNSPESVSLIEALLTEPSP